MTIQAVHPVLMSSDIAASLDFYARLGFRELFRDAPSEPRYAVVARDGAELHLQWHAEEHWRLDIDRPTYRFLVSDVDALYSELLDRGTLPAWPSSRSPWATPGGTPWGTRELHVRDPDGNGLHFYQPVTEGGQGGAKLLRGRRRSVAPRRSPRSGRVMRKLMVVLYRRPDLSVAEFEEYLREVHGPLAEALPGLVRYTQSFVAEDPKRRRPGWDAIVELCWQDGPAMETAWASPQGQEATEDLARFVDLSRTSWAVVDGVRRR